MTKPEEVHVQLTAKEKKRLKQERDKEKERIAFETNFKPSSLYINKMGLHKPKSFVANKPYAIIVYHQDRLVKLDIIKPMYQPSAVPDLNIEGPKKDLLITPDELYDFYNHSKVREFHLAGRGLEIEEEPRFIFEKD